MWEKVKLGEVCFIIGGYAFKSDQYINNAVPLIRISNINENQIYLDYECSIKDNNKYNQYEILNGDILIALSGATTGKFGIFNSHDKAYLNQRVGLIRKTERSCQKFIFYYLNIIKDEILRKAGGAAQPNISTTELGNFEIPLPPIQTQERIAEILDKADELRRKDKDLQEKYDQLAQAIFIDMFGDPVKNNKGWEVKKLDDFCSKILSGNTPKGGSEVYVKSGISFFRSQNVWKNKLELSDIAYIDEATHQKMKNSSLKDKDILITKTGRINTENSSLGRAALYRGKNDSANINGHVYLIRINSSEILPEFVVFILTTIQYRDHIRSVCVGGIDKRQLNKEHIQDFPIILPPIHLQEEFVKKIELINELKAKVNAEKSEELFQSLLQKAFKGELVS